MRGMKIGSVSNAYVRLKRRLSDVVCGSLNSELVDHMRGQDEARSWAVEARDPAIGRPLNVRNS